MYGKGEKSFIFLINRTPLMLYYLVPCLKIQGAGYWVLGSWILGY